MRTTWLLALLCVGGLTCAVFGWLYAIGWFEIPLDEITFHPRVVVLGAALFIASHVVPRVVPRSRMRARVRVEFVSGGTYRESAFRRSIIENAAALDGARIMRERTSFAIAIACSIAIVALGFTSIESRHACYGGPRQNPLEWLAYFVASLFAITTHYPRGLKSVATSRMKRRF